MDRGKADQKLDTAIPPAHHCEVRTRYNAARVSALSSGCTSQVSFSVHRQTDCLYMERSSWPLHILFERQMLPTIRRLYRQSGTHSTESIYQLALLKLSLPLVQ